MKFTEVNEQIRALVEGSPEIEVGIDEITDAFELAILHSIMTGGNVSLKHLGEFSQVKGDIIFTPSSFFRQAVALVGAG